MESSAVKIVDMSVCTLITTGAESDTVLGTSSSGRTTMAILNIPYRYPKVKLQAEIVAECPSLDYFHFPRDSRRGRNRGFAFVNFRYDGDAEVFHHAFHNRVLSCPGADEKMILVVPASLQGFDGNAKPHLSATAHPTKGMRRGRGHAAKTNQKFCQHLMCVLSCEG